MTDMPAAPAEDADLDAIFQQLIVGVAGMTASLVRPRWQPNPPKQPEPTVDWCAIGVIAETPDSGPAIKHNGDGLGSDTSIRHSELEVLASFYGPNAQKNANILRDGLGISQNREVLEPLDIAFVSCGATRPIPDLVNQQWIKRRDMLLTFRRKTTRIYQIRNINSADIHLFDDSGHMDELVTVSPPSP
jgi:hypothetical protein